MKRLIGNFCLTGYLLSGMAVAQADETKPASAYAHARSQFILYCSGCHQADGAGHPNVGIPSMQNTLGNFVRSPAGRAFLVQVPGARNATVSDAELAELTNWELQTFSKKTLPENYQPYTSAEVTQARSAPPSDIPRARAQIIKDLQSKNLIAEDGIK